MTCTQIAIREFLGGSGVGIVLGAIFGAGVMRAHYLIRAGAYRRHRVH